MTRPHRAFGYAASGVSYIPLAYTDRGTHEALAERFERAVAMPLGEPVPLASR